MFKLLAWRKIICLVLTVALLSNQGLGALAESNVWTQRREKKPVAYASLSSQLPIVQPALNSPSKIQNSVKPLNTLSTTLQSIAAAVPFTHATVRDTYDAKNDEAPIVVIQDIHLNTEAQLNIANVLQALFKEKKAALVGVEGAFLSSAFERFREIPNLDVKAKALLESGALNGASYAGLTSPLMPPPFIGVEDVNLYEANVQAYLDAMEEKPALLTRLDAEQKALDSAKAVHFSSELRDFDDLLISYQAGKTGFGAYVSRLAEKNEDLNIDVERFIEAFRLESAIDFNAVERERKALLDSLTKRLSPDEIKTLLEESLSYRMGRSGFGTYYGRLRSRCEEKGLSLKKTPAFDNYIRYVLLSDGIKAETLFNAVDDLEKKMGTRLAKTDREKNLLEQSERLCLTRKLAEFSLTAKEWRRYRELKRGEKKTSAFERFYEEADRRSLIMVDKLADKAAAGPVVLITGGFHTDEITTMLRDRKRSYLVVSPKITKVDLASASAYLSIFAREKTTLQKIFSGEKLFINPARVANVAFEHLPSPPPLVDREIAGAEETEQTLTGKKPGLIGKAARRIRSVRSVIRGQRSKALTENVQQRTEKPRANLNETAKREAPLFVERMFPQLSAEEKSRIAERLIAGTINKSPVSGLFDRFYRFISPAFRAMTVLNPFNSRVVLNEDFSEEELASVLFHEWTHLARVLGLIKSDAVASAVGDFKRLETVQTGASASDQAGAPPSRLRRLLSFPKQIVFALIFGSPMTPDEEKTLFEWIQEALRQKDFRAVGSIVRFKESDLGLLGHLMAYLRQFLFGLAPESYQFSHRISLVAAALVARNENSPSLEPAWEFLRELSASNQSDVLSGKAIEDALINVVVKPISKYEPLRRILGQAYASLDPNVAPLVSEGEILDLLSIFQQEKGDFTFTANLYSHEPQNSFSIKKTFTLTVFRTNTATGNRDPKPLIRISLDTPTADNTLLTFPANEIHLGNGSMMHELVYEGTDINEKYAAFFKKLAQLLHRRGLTLVIGAAIPGPMDRLKKNGFEKDAKGTYYYPTSSLSGSIKEGSAGYTVFGASFWEIPFTTPFFNWLGLWLFRNHAAKTSFWSGRFGWRTWLGLAGLGVMTFGLISGWTGWLGITAMMIAALPWAAEKGRIFAEAHPGRSPPQRVALAAIGFILAMATVSFPILMGLISWNVFYGLLANYLLHAFYNVFVLLVLPRLSKRFPRMAQWREILTPAVVFFKEEDPSLPITEYTPFRIAIEKAYSALPPEKKQLLTANDIYELMSIFQQDNGKHEFGVAFEIDDAQFGIKIFRIDYETGQEDARPYLNLRFEYPTKKLLSFEANEIGLGHGAMASKFILPQDPNFNNKFILFFQTLSTVLAKYDLTMVIMSIVEADFLIKNGFLKDGNRFYYPKPAVKTTEAPKEGLIEGDKNFPSGNSSSFGFLIGLNILSRIFKSNPSNIGRLAVFVPLMMVGLISVGLEYGGMKTLLLGRLDAVWVALILVAALVAHHLLRRAVNGTRGSPWLGSASDLAVLSAYFLVFTLVPSHLYIAGVIHLAVDFVWMVKDYAAVREILKSPFSPIAFLLGLGVIMEFIPLESAVVVAILATTALVFDPLYSLALPFIKRIHRLGNDLEHRARFWQLLLFSPNRQKISAFINSFPSDFNEDDFKGEVDKFLSGLSGATGIPINISENARKRLEWPNENTSVRRKLEESVLMLVKVNKLVSKSKPPNDRQAAALQTASLAVESFARSIGLPYHPVKISFIPMRDIPRGGHGAYFALADTIILGDEIKGNQLIIAAIHEMLHALGRGFSREETNEAATQYFAVKIFLAFVSRAASSPHDVLKAIPGVDEPHNDLSSYRWWVRPFARLLAIPYERALQQAYFFGEKAELQRNLQSLAQQDRDEFVNELFLPEKKLESLFDIKTEETPSVKGNTSSFLYLIALAFLSRLFKSDSRITRLAIFVPLMIVGLVSVGIEYWGMKTLLSGQFDAVWVALILIAALIAHHLLRRAVNGTRGSPRLIFIGSVSDLIVVINYFAFSYLAPAHLYMAGGIHLLIDLSWMIYDSGYFAKAVLATIKQTGPEETPVVKQIRAAVTAFARSNGMLLPEPWDRSAENAADLYKFIQSEAAKYGIELLDEPLEIYRFAMQCYAYSGDLSLFIDVLINEINTSEYFLSNAMPPSDENDKLAAEANAVLSNVLTSLGYPFTPRAFIILPLDKFNFGYEGRHFKLRNISVLAEQAQGHRTLSHAVHEGLHGYSAGFAEFNLDEGMTTYLEMKGMMMRDGITDFSYDSMMKYILYKYVEIADEETTFQRIRTEMARQNHTDFSLPAIRRFVVENREFVQRIVTVRYHPYRDHLGAILRLMEVAGEGVMIKAYVTGDMSELKGILGPKLTDIAQLGNDRQKHHSAYLETEMIRILELNKEPSKLRILDPFLEKLKNFLNAQVDADLLPDGKLKFGLNLLKQIKVKGAVFGGPVRDWKTGVNKKGGDVDFLLRIDTKGSTDKQTLYAHQLRALNEFAQGLRDSGKAPDATVEKLMEGRVYVEGYLIDFLGWVDENNQVTGKFGIDFTTPEFSINMIGFDDEGKVIDPYDGLEDLNNGVLRLVGHDVENVMNHQTVLRALRFIIDKNLMFQLEPKSRRLIFNFFKNVPDEERYRGYIRDVRFVREKINQLRKEADSLRNQPDFEEKTNEAVSRMQKEIIEEMAKRPRFFAGADYVSDTVYALEETAPLLFGLNQVPVDLESLQGEALIAQLVDTFVGRSAFNSSMKPDFSGGKIHVRNDPSGISAAIGEIYNAAPSAAAATRLLREAEADDLLDALGLNVERVEILKHIENTLMNFPPDDREWVRNSYLQIIPAAENLVKTKTLDELSRQLLETKEKERARMASDETSEDFFPIETIELAIAVKTDRAQLPLIANTSSFGYLIALKLFSYLFNPKEFFKPGVFISLAILGLFSVGLEYFGMKWLLLGDLNWASIGLILFAAILAHNLLRGMNLDRKRHAALLWTGTLSDLIVISIYIVFAYFFPANFYVAGFIHLGIDIFWMAILFLTAEVKRKTTEFPDRDAGPAFLTEIRILRHADFGDLTSDKKGALWPFMGLVRHYVIGPYFLDGFNLRKTMTNPKKAPSKIRRLTQPLNSENNRFSNLDGLTADTAQRADPIAAEVNAALGLQWKIRQMIERGIIGSDTFVILSHTHFLAGLAELAKAVNNDAYLFDTAVYFPAGQAEGLGDQFQIWSEELGRAKNQQAKARRAWAGGLAVALNGKRGNDATTIDPASIFGSAEAFGAFLKEKGFKKVVVITEEPVLDEEKNNFLKLRSLKNGFFQDSNKDLYDYLQALTDSGTLVHVVSGDTRPPNRFISIPLSDREFQIPFDPLNIREAPKLTVEANLDSPNIPQRVTMHSKGIRFVLFLRTGLIGETGQIVAFDNGIQRDPGEIEDEIEFFKRQIVDPKNREILKNVFDEIAKFPEFKELIEQQEKESGQEGDSTMGATSSFGYLIGLNIIARLFKFDPSKISRWPIFIPLMIIGFASVALEYWGMKALLLGEMHSGLVALIIVSALAAHALLRIAIPNSNRGSPWPKGIGSISDSLVVLNYLLFAYFLPSHFYSAGILHAAIDLGWMIFDYRNLTMTDDVFPEKPKEKFEIIVEDYTEGRNLVANQNGIRFVFSLKNFELLAIQQTNTSGIAVRPRWSRMSQSLDLMLKITSEPVRTYKTHYDFEDFLKNIYWQAETGEIPKLPSVARDFITTFLKEKNGERKKLLAEKGAREFFKDKIIRRGDGVFYTGPFAGAPHIKDLGPGNSGPSFIGIIGKDKSVCVSLFSDLSGNFSLQISINGIDRITGRFKIDGGRYELVNIGLQHDTGTAAGQTRYLMDLFNSSRVDWNEKYLLMNFFDQARAAGMIFADEVLETIGDLLPLGRGEKIPGTDFVLGADNDENAIQSLRNWVRYRQTVESFQPGRSSLFESETGFLAKNQDWVDLLLEDRARVKALDIPKETMAQWIRDVLSGIDVEKIETRNDHGEPETILVYNGQRLRITVDASRGMQAIPIPGPIPSSKDDFYIENLDNGARIKVTHMQPALITLYGFFQGSSYRTAPEDIVRVFTGRNPDKGSRLDDTPSSDAPGENAADRLADVVNALAGDRVVDALNALQDRTTLGIGETGASGDLAQTVETWDKWKDNAAFQKRFFERVGKNLQGDARNLELIALVLHTVGTTGTSVSSPRVYVFDKYKAGVTESPAIVMAAIMRGGLTQPVELRVNRHDKKRYEAVAAALNKLAKGLGQTTPIVTVRPYDSAEEAGLKNDGSFHPETVSNLPQGRSYETILFILSNGLAYEGPLSNVKRLEQIIPRAEQIRLRDFERVVRQILSAA